MVGGVGFSGGGGELGTNVDIQKGWALENFGKCISFQIQQFCVSIVYSIYVKFLGGRHRKRSSVFFCVLSAFIRIRIRVPRGA